MNWREKLTFYALLGVLYPIAVLPYPVLYLLADCTYVCLYYVLGYRREVVQRNLRHSFPDADDVWLKKTEKAHYKWFADCLLEIVKALVMSEKTADKRCRFVDIRLIEALVAKGEPDLLAVSGHYGNWEWTGIPVATRLPYHPLGIYKPIKAKAVDALFHYSRARFGMGLIPMKEARRQLEQQRGGGKLMFFLSDQYPGRDRGEWFWFLNQPTKVFMGAEQLAKQHDIPIIYGSIRRVKRGYYEIHIQLITDKPSALPPGELTRRHVKMLEAEIQRDPVPWLWSHKRWKHAPPDDALIR